MFGLETRFLVVDDFKTMRAIVKRSLQQMGYTLIDEAEDGQQALEMLEKALADKKPYECVVSDWNMPRLTGLELLRKVRAHESMKQLPFMLVTAENEQKQVVDAAMAGVSNYVVKPFTPAEFSKKLGLAWQRHFKAKAA